MLKLACEAGKREKDKEVAALTARFSQAEKKKEEEMAALAARIAQAETVQRKEMAALAARISQVEIEKEKEVTALKARLSEAETALVQQKREVIQIWEAITLASCQQTTDADITIIRAADTTKVELSNLEPLSAIGCYRLACMTSLKSLSICGSVNEAALKYIPSMPWLEELKLQSTKVDDSVILEISHLPNLHRLNLIETAVTEVGLGHLTSLSTLEDLFFSRSYNCSCSYDSLTFSFAGLANLGKLTWLQTLDLGNSLVSDGALPHLRPLTKLSWLCLPEYITEQGLQHVTCFQNLKTIYLKSPFGDYGIACLRALPSLEDVGLADYWMVDRVKTALPGVDVFYFKK
ncbi:unnamed protein product [Closterium sp. NIES-54]